MNKTHFTIEQERYYDKNGSNYQTVYRIFSHIKYKAWIFFIFYRIQYVLENGSNDIRSWSSLKAAENFIHDVLCVDKPYDTSEKLNVKTIICDEN